MLSRVYISNYKCFLNFELRPTKRQLIVGQNGSGKSTFFEVLSLLRDFILTGGEANHYFGQRTRTRWQSDPKQTFEIEFFVNPYRYIYRLVLESWGPNQEPRVAHEWLQHDGRPLFEFHEGEIRLYNDRYEEKVAYEADWSRGGLATINARRDNTKLTAFKDLFSTVYCLRIDPRVMGSVTEKEDALPAVDLSNFSSWYRHVLQEDSAVSSAFQEALRHVLDGFERFDLVKTGPTTRQLVAKLSARVEGNGSGKKALIDFSLDELSDGQRVLAALYFLSHCVVRSGAVLVLDEPENFVSLAEIQPWLLGLGDQAEEFDSQVILISHHPEVIDLEVDRGVLFTRDGVGPVRVEPWGGRGNGTLRPSELLARGWEDV